MAVRQREREHGWAGETYPRAAAYHLRLRSAPTAFKWCKGHNGTLGNERADALAYAGATKPRPDDIDTSIPDTFDLTGAKLATISQSTAYTTLTTQTKPPAHKRATTSNLDIARHATHALSNELPTDASIWKNCRNPSIRRPVQLFLFKALHNALKIGDYWAAIPNPQYHTRATCHYHGCDNATESLEHILLDCQSPEKRTIWHLTKTLWPQDQLPWPTITIGTVLGCGSLTLTPPAATNQPPPKTHPGTNRLLQILISEAAHLIWTLRCDRVINGTTHSTESIETRWLHKIDHRLQLDRYIASKIRRSKLSASKVKHTWLPVLHPPPDDNSNWPTALEVLVGIKLPRPSNERGYQGVHRAPHPLPHVGRA